MVTLKINPDPKNQDYMTYKARLYYPKKQGYVKVSSNKTNDLNTLKT